MVLNRLQLVNFRNYPKTTLDFSSGVNLIVGPNAVGKTNLLEAVYLLSTGNSFKALRNEELIRWGQDFSLIEARMDESSLKISLNKKESRVQKEFWVNQVKKTRRLFLESFLVVLFRPEEIRVITGSPSRRREFLDQILSPLDWEYYQAILAYRRAVVRRNMVLLNIFEKKAGEEELFFWDNTLAKNGEMIRKKREEFLNFTNRFFKNFQAGKLSHLFCQYRSSPVSLERLKELLSRDLVKKTTTIGPHRDDFTITSSKFKVDNGSLASWGSRGQQRLAILALKLAQLAYIEEKKLKKPVILLDDIFSELDDKSRGLVVSLLENYQTLLTSTEEVIKKGKRIYL